MRSPECLSDAACTRTGLNSGIQCREDGLELLRTAGSKLVDRVKAIVVMDVQEARPIVSPVYDGSVCEAEMIQTVPALR
jgi:hypothetical protein